MYLLPSVVTSNTSYLYPKITDFSIVKVDKKPKKKKIIKRLQVVKQKYYFSSNTEKIIAKAISDISSLFNQNTININSIIKYIQSNSNFKIKTYEAIQELTFQIFNKYNNFSFHNNKYLQIYKFINTNYDINLLPTYSKKEIVNALIKNNKYIIKKSKKTINQEKTKICHMLLSPTMLSLIEFQKSLTSTEIINNNIQNDGNKYYFNEAFLIKIKYLMNNNIISNEIWKIYSDLCNNYIFINQRNKHIHNCIMYNIEYIVHNNEYNIINQNPEVAQLIYVIFDGYIIISKYNIINDFINVYNLYASNITYNTKLLFIFENVILKFFQKTLDKMIEFPKHLGFDYYLNIREDKDENNIKVVTDNYNILFKLMYNEEHPFDEILIIGTVMKQTKLKQSTQFSTAKHLYETFILITSILNYKFDHQNSYSRFRNTLTELCNKNILIRERKNRKTAYTYQTNKHNTLLHNLTAQSDLLNLILNITDHQIATFSPKTYNYTTTDYNTIELKLKYIKNILNNIIESELNINPTYFNNKFNLTLKTYRKNLTNLNNYIQKNGLTRNTNYNINSTMTLTPLTIKKKETNPLKYLSAEKFYNRYKWVDQLNNKLREINSP